MYRTSEMNFYCKANSIVFGFILLLTNVKGLKFTQEPQDMIVQFGAPAILHCEAKGSTNLGSRPADIRWRGPDGQDISFIGETYRSQLPNGSLYFNSVLDSQGLTGTYQCMATVEPIGTIVSRTAILQIAALPEILTQPIDQVVFLGQIAYFTCLVTSVDKKLKYSITWLKDDRPLKLDNVRMTKLPSGALEIDEVTHIDRGVYRCNVSDNNQHRLSHEANLNIDLDDILRESITAPDFIALPHSQTAIEGDTVTLDCAANGNPKPEIMWLNNGFAIDMNDLDSRFHIIGTGSLEIINVKESDTGVYQCRADNREDSLDATASLDIQVPPKFTVSPSDKIASVKEDLTLECAVYGKPKPTVQWLKNGEIIKPNDYLQTVDGDNLKILGLMISDAGIFQCVGTNSAGSVQGTATLTIMGPASKLVQNNSSNKSTHNFNQSHIYKAYNQSLSLNTSTSADTMRPLGTNLNTRNILKSLISDENTEFKNTDNEKDTSSSNNDGLHFPDHKLNTKKFLTSLISSNVEDSESELENSSVPNQVSYIGHTLSALTPVPFFTSTESYPTSDLDGTVLGGPLVDNIGDITSLPSQPRNVTAVIIKPRFVTLSWEEPERKNGEITAYSIYYRLQGSQRERVVSTKSKVEEFNIASLQPSKHYIFRVVANNSFGPGESSEILMVTTQAEEDIAGPPLQVTAFPIGPTRISVSWQAPIVTNGDIIKYKVYYMEGDSNEESHLDTAELSTELMNLLPYTSYNIYVVAVNTNGPGTASSEITVRTYSDIPSEPPYNVTLEPTSSTSVTVHWQPPPLQERNGVITGYKIKYKKHNRKRSETYSTPANVRYFVLKNLERMSAYQVKLCAMNVNGSGPSTDWLHVETYENDLDESQVPGPPSPLRTRTTSDSITVTWNPPREQYIKVRGYTLGWGKGIPDVYNQLLDDNARYYVIRDLEPNCEYVISLRARNEVGDGPPVYSNVRTREDTPVETSSPLVPPVGLKAIVLSSTAVVVYWTDTTLSKSQYVTDKRHYTVRYTTTGSPRYRYYNATDLNCMIDDLKPNSQYEFTVKLVKGKRESPWSMEVLNVTQQAPPSTPPRDLTVVAPPLKDNNHVTLQWLPPRIPNGPITGYVIFYTTDNSRRDRDWVVEGVVGDKHSTTLRSMSANTVYYFKVQARNSKGYGPMSSVVSYTTDSGVTFSDSGSSKDGRGAMASSLWMYLAIGGSVVGLTVIAVIVICCRRNYDTNSLEGNKKSYQKNNAANIKPPDLWIHHDQMELKALEKANSTNSACNDGASSSGAMTLPRSIGHDFDPIANTPLPHPHPSNSLDKRTYVPGYIVATAMPINTGNLTDSSARPSYPRTQYSISRAHVTMDQNNVPHNVPLTSNMVGHNSISIAPTLSMTSSTIPLGALQNSYGPLPQLTQNVSVASSLVQTPENPYGYDTVTSSYSQLPIEVKRGQGHPLKSFSVPAPPNNSTPNTPNSKHNVSQVTIRPQNPSPYKKSVVTGNRLQAGPVVAHSSEEIQRLAPSHSTEELHQEMANLEGLMKDLNAITASEFEC